MRENRPKVDINKSLIFIICNTPWQWSVDYVNQTAAELARRDNVVVCYLYADIKYWKEIVKNRERIFLFKKYQDNIYLYRPFQFIPFRRFGFVETLNSFLNILFAKLFLVTVSIFKKIKKKIFWVFDSNMFPLFSFFKGEFYLVYDCVDFLTLGSKKNIEDAKKNEKYLTENADLVVANSKVLQKHLQKYRKDVGLVPQGFRIEGFKINRKKNIGLKLKPPIIGFIGGINNRLDTSLLLQLIKNNPKWNFVLWGPIQEEILTDRDRSDQIMKILGLPNVFSGESKDKKEIPEIVSQFDVGMIPYDISQDFNKYCYPMKVFEYFYLGKPVVSTDILELRRFPKLVMIGHNACDWENIIKKLLSKRWPKQNIRNQINLAEQNSWKNKIDSIAKYLKNPRYH